VHTQPNGLSYISTPVSIERYLQGRFAQDAFEGPLTDYESSGSDEDANLVGYWDTDTETTVSGCEKPRPMTRIARKKARSKRQRNEIRQKVQAAQGKAALKAVVKKRQQESTWDAIQVGYSLEKSASVSATGWTGKVAKGLPLENPVLCELIEKDKMAYFPWNGR
jgi:hypothetical protein